MAATSSPSAEVRATGFSIKICFLALAA